MANILIDAEEEIERTAQEAAREVAAIGAGEINFQKTIAEHCRQEAIRMDGKRRVWRACSVIEALVILGGMFILGISQ